MDQPLFGEQRREAQVFQYLIMFLVSGFTVFSLIVGVVKGVSLHDPTHFAMVATLAVTFIDLAILYWWWRDKEDRLHPKFKWLLFALIVTVFLTGATLNAYVWKKPVVCPDKPTCDDNQQWNTKYSCIAYFVGLYFIPPPQQIEKRRRLVVLS